MANQRRYKQRDPNLAENFRSVGQGFNYFGQGANQFKRLIGLGGTYKPTRNRYYILENRVRRLENRRGEWKTHDVTINNHNVTKGGTVFHLTGIAQGDTNATRDGDILKIQSVQWRLELQASNTQRQTTMTRVIVFFDTQNAGVMPVVGTVITTGAASSYLNHRSTASKGRYQFIYDRTYRLVPGQNLTWDENITSHKFTVATTQEDLQTDKYYKRFKGRRVFYLGGGSAVADAGKGNLYVLVFTNIDDAADQAVFSMHTRIRFTEQ